MLACNGALISTGRMLKQHDAPAPLLAAAVSVSLAVPTSSLLYRPTTS